MRFKDLKKSIKSFWKSKKVGGGVIKESALWMNQLAVLLTENSPSRFQEKDKYFTLKSNSGITYYKMKQEYTLKNKGASRCHRITFLSKWFHKESLTSEEPFCFTKAA